MEIPKHIQNLYRHWEYHIRAPHKRRSSDEIFTDPKLFKEISWFIHERISIWNKKISGESEPFTNDNILATYRFCNILRELDKQTLYFHELLNPLRDDFPLWLLNMFYCRMVARPETVEHAGLLTFNTQENQIVFERLSNSPRPRFGTPYVFPVSTVMKSATPTRELFITQHLPHVMEEVAQEISKWNRVSVYDGVEKILPIFGFNHSFLWTEVLIDASYQYPEYIDLFGRFPVGPGSLPTMKRVNAKIDPSALVQNLAELGIPTPLTINNSPIYLSAENWEGIGCEFRKYTNLKDGKGRKRIYSRALKV